MRKEKIIKDLSIFNINTFSNKLYNNKKIQLSHHSSNFINNFKLECVIGKGGFGKVWKVKYKLNGKQYAMKIMSKLKIIRKNSIKNILNEKHLLSKLHNPFLVNMVFSFQDIDNLYLIMDLLLGGDLRYHINNSEIFNETQLKFFLSCTILGLDYLHQNKIIHKDIKPENLVFDKNGYLHITDLGISKIYQVENKKENSGTPGYMAPEVLFNKNHDYSVDFFALGVIGYEIIMKKRPYKGKDKRELRKEIISRQAKLKSEELFNQGWSKNCVEFINGLLQRKKDKRLGKNGVKELMEHPWFEKFDWNELISLKLKPNWRPPLSENFYHNIEEEDNIGKETELIYEEIKNKEDYQKYFLNYSFNERDLEIKMGGGGEGGEKEKNKKMNLNHDLTFKIIKKLKDELKKFTCFSKNNNILYKNPLRFSNDNVKNMNSRRLIDNNSCTKKDISSLRLTKSYYLYNNFSSKENYVSSSNNISTKYNYRKRKNNLSDKIKLNDISNEGSNFYKSSYNYNCFCVPKFASKIKLSFNQNNKNTLYFNKSNNNTNNQLPLIQKMKKSSSVGNFGKIKFGFNKKSKLTIDNWNN